MKIKKLLKILILLAYSGLWFTDWKARAGASLFSSSWDLKTSKSTLLA